MAASGLGTRERKKLDGVLLHQLGISICEASDLEKLASWDIVFVIDDSGSMSRKTVPRPKRKPGVEYPTRWEELRQTLDAMIGIAMCLDADGVDLHFLNMGSLAGVTSIGDPRLQQFLARGPQAGTPLTETVARALAGLQANKRYLFVILTDGEPNGGPKRFKAVVRDAIAKGNVAFQIMACTGDEAEVAWLNDFDAEFDRVDVTDDYATEREEVMRTGRYADFSRADWVVKALLGPVDRRFDCMDEGGAARLLAAKVKSGECGACSIS